MTNALEQKLQTIHNENQPDPAFAEQLEQELRRIHLSTTSTRPIQSRKVAIAHRMMAIAASFLIVLGLFTTVPPLRSLAQSIFDFFIPGDGYSASDEYADVVTVETVAEAESIAGMEALEWVEGGFNILHIGAEEGFISIAYERENDRGVLMHVSKWRTDTRPGQLPISPDAAIVNTTVNGESAQFAAGYWFGSDPEWRPEHYRNLRWRDEEFSYSLQVSAPFADTLEEVVAVAEQLQ